MFEAILKARAIACALLFGAVFTCSATSVIAPRFDELVDRAELIFTGEVIARRSEWREENGRRAIVTLVTFGVERTHKGAADQRVELRFLGGTVGDVSLDVAEIPQFKLGERAVLFVAGNGSAVSPLVGFFHGKFPLRKRADAVEEVLTHTGRPLSAVTEVGGAKSKVSATGDKAMSHDEFAASIRDHITRKQKSR